MFQRFCRQHGIPVVKTVNQHFALVDVAPCEFEVKGQAGIYEPPVALYSGTFCVHIIHHLQKGLAVRRFGEQLSRLHAHLADFVISCAGAAAGGIGLTLDFGYLLIYQPVHIRMTGILLDIIIQIVCQLAVQCIELRIVAVGLLPVVFGKAFVFATHHLVLPKGILPGAAHALQLIQIVHRCLGLSLLDGTLHLAPQCLVFGHRIGPGRRGQRQRQ